MDAIQAWIKDRKNLPIVAAGTLIIVVLAVLLSLRMTGMIGGGGGQMSSDTGVPPYGGQPGMPQPGVPGPGGPQSPGMPIPQGGPPTGPIPGAPQQAAVPASAQLAPMLPYRKDPFLPLAGVPTRSDKLAYILPMLRRPRIAPAPVIRETGGEVEVTEVLPPQPYRRMAGVLWNGRISAILETNGETDIVRPGKEITRGNSRVRVESIQQDCIILKTLDTRTPMTIKVNMAGSVISTESDVTQPGLEMYPNQ
jgi:hypothetical protein